MSRLFACLFLTACGLGTLQVKPVKVEPIQMTIDVNVHDTTPAAPANQHNAKP